MGRRAAAPRKVQSNLYVNRSLRDRVDAVALVIPDTRAEVYRRAIEIGMTRLENDMRETMRIQLGPHATRFGLDIPTLAGLMAERDLCVHDVAQMDRFPE